MTWWKKDMEPALRDIPGMTHAEATSLERNDIRSVKQFQEQLDRNGAAVLLDLSQRTGISRAKMGQLLADSLQLSARPITNSFWHDHWSDFAVVVLLLLFAMECLRPWISKPLPRVVAASDIPAFSPIEKGQLRTEGTTSPEQMEQMKLVFTGKYSLSSIRKGEAIPDKVAHLQAPDVSNRVILRILIKSMPRIEAPDLPQKVELIFPPGDKEQDVPMVPALVLAVEAQAVTVALDESEAKKVRQRLGSAQVYLELRRP